MYFTNKDYIGEQELTKKKLISWMTVGLLAFTTLPVNAQEVVLRQDIRVEQAIATYNRVGEKEQEVLDALDFQFGWDFALKLGEFGSAKDGSGFRLAGTEASQQTSAYIYETLESFGYEPEYYEFPITEWNFYEASLEIDGHKDLKLPVIPFANTPATKEDGLKAEIEYIGYGTKEELEGVDLTGKIALINMDVDQMLWHNNAALQARLHGAEAVVLYYTTYYGTDESGEAGFVGDWSGRRIDIPVLSIPQKYGKQLAELAEKETLTATLVSDVEMNESGTGRNVVTKIEGSKYPDEYVIVDAHHDAFFTSMQDDSMPVGLMMTMAKAMSEVGYTPERTLLLVSTDAEETGDIDTFYDWMMGSYLMLEDKIDEWSGKIVNAHILEMFGMKGAEELGFRAPDIMYPFAKSVIQDYIPKSVAVDQLDVDNFITTSSDEWAYSYFGMPTTRTRNESKADEVYHTALDNEAHADFDLFKDNVVLQTKMILRLDQMTMMPYDLATIGEKYVLALDQEALQARGIDTTLLDAAKAFIKDADKLYEQGIKIQELYNEAEGAGRDMAEVDKLIGTYNRQMREVSEKVIKGTQYVALDQVLTQTQYYQNLPGEFEEAINYLVVGDAEGMLENFDMDSDDMGQYAQHYMQFMEYPVWINAYRESFEPESKALKRNWTDGILLKYYDIYHPMESILEKSKMGNTHFNYEIEAFVTARNDAQKRLEIACKEDAKMWKAANKQLPMSLSNELLKKLQAMK